MVQAGKGTGALDTAIQNLGYTSGKDLLSKEGFAGAMELLRSESVRMGVGFEELVGSGRGLFTALKMDAKGMKELRENTKGGTSDLRDFHDTINAVNKVTQTSRSINKMKETAGVTATNLGGAFSPLLTGILSGINVPLRYMNKKMEMSQLVGGAREEYESKFQKTIGKGMDFRAFSQTKEGERYLMQNSPAYREAKEYIDQYEGKNKSAVAETIKLIISTDEEGNVSVNPKVGPKIKVTNGIPNTGG
jgi:hypothetical protein